MKMECIKSGHSMKKMDFMIVNLKYPIVKNM